MQSRRTPLVMISCCSIQWLLRLLWCGWAGSQKLLRLCSSYEPLCLSYSAPSRRVLLSGRGHVHSG